MLIFKVAYVALNKDVYDFKNVFVCLSLSPSFLFIIITIINLTLKRDVYISRLHIAYRCRQHPSPFE